MRQLDYAAFNWLVRVNLMAFATPAVWFLVHDIASDLRAITCS